MAMTFEKEFATYQRELPNLLEKEGRFVLIKGDTIDSVWDSYADALEQGYRIYGVNQPFFVKQIRKVETPIYVL